MPTQSVKGLDQPEPTALVDGVDPGGGPGRMLLGVFETLDRAEIPYCVLHGYEGYPRQIASDVDCMISARVRPRQLAGLFHESSASRTDANLVGTKNYWFVFAGRNADRSPCFLVLDFSIDFDLGGLNFYTGREVLESRRRHHRFWIPAARIEFGCYLARKIAKAQLNAEQGSRLSALYAQDPVGCQQQIARFWSARSTALIADAASSGDWEPVRRFLCPLGAEMRSRAIWRRPWHAIVNRSHHVGRQVRSLCRPDGGLIVAFLGPDGAGKSSVIKSVPRGLAGMFARTICYGFAPGLFSWLHRTEGPNTQPHAAPARSPITSVVRALCYWFVYYLVCYRLTVRRALAHSTLVLHDRHLIDALVDPKRYRYSGPTWLLRLIWRFVPKPDLVILLDASPEVLQTRKQEVPFAESLRQGQAYRSLVASMANGHVVDAVRPLEQVVGEVHDIILRHLTTRIAHRFALESNLSHRGKGEASESGTNVSHASARS